MDKFKIIINILFYMYMICLYIYIYIIFWAFIMATCRYYTGYTTRGTKNPKI